ncbi:hypothetical protein [Streptomyces sp. NPDC058280]|uniref:hypothetical protein n=1 Tax=Streptomyces sp. NPDC058280 TaxID=3346419 RepID=UPI0036E1AC8D
MPDAPNWRSRISQRVFVDVRTGAVGYLLGERDQEAALWPLTSGQEWTAPADQVRPATPQEVASALAAPGGVSLSRAAVAPTRP